MKLLSPTKVKMDTRKQEERQKTILANLNDEIIKRTAELNVAREDVAAFKAQCTLEIQEQENATKTKKQALLNEIALLEEKRAELLKPVDEILEQAKRELKESETKRANVEVQEKELVNLIKDIGAVRSKIYRAFEYADDAEQQALRERSEAASVLVEAKNERDGVKEMRISLDENIQSFEKQKKELVNDLYKKQIAVDKKEQYLLEKEKDLADREKRLKSRQATIQAYERNRSK